MTRAAGTGRALSRREDKFEPFPWKKEYHRIKIGIRDWSRSMSDKRLVHLVVLALLVPSALPAAPAFAAAKPTAVGQCVTTAIRLKGSRLEGMPDSGDAVAYANGIVGVSYERVPGLRTARAGDRVKLCLTSLPAGCPPGDDRGKTYKATDLRTHKSWELPDAEHMCGGA
jgi:hypothetical protein